MHHTERVDALFVRLNLLLLLAVSFLPFPTGLVGQYVDDADEEAARFLGRRLEPGLAGYVLFILVGIFVPVVAVFGYLAVAIAIIFPFGIKKHLSGQEG